MSRRRRNDKKVVKYKKPNIEVFGIMAFVVIVGYVIINLALYYSKPRISIYEVTENQLSSDYRCTAMVLRDETVVNTTDDGYLNYFYADGTRVGKNTVVYTLDESGEIYSLLSQSREQTTLSKGERKLLWENISEFRREYSDSKYSTVTDFVYDVENTVLEISTSSMADDVRKILKENNLAESFSSVSTEKSGLIAYSVDGYEDMKVDEVTPDSFDGVDYEKTQLRTTEKVDKGAPAYRLVTGEDWTMVVQLSEELYEQLTSREESDRKEDKNSYMNIILTKEDIPLRVVYKTFSRDGGYFAEVKMKDYIVHYVDDRFIEVEISMDSAKGLKLPNSSILTKEFYEVPAEYFTEGGEKSSSGLIKEVYDNSGEVSYDFVEASSYYTTEDGKAYVDMTNFSDGDYIRNQSNQERYQLGATKKLKGVYNVNYGYCVFKRVDVLYENEEYSIVSEYSEGGLSSFDHIIVDAKTVSEDDMINNYKSE